MDEQVFCRSEAVNPHNNPYVIIPSLLPACHQEAIVGGAGKAPAQVLAMEHKKDDNRQLEESRLLGNVNDAITNGELPGGLNIRAALSIAKYIKEHTRLTILGFDVLIGSSSGSHYVIDVNYFPSCKKIAGIQKAIRGAIFERIVSFKETFVNY